LLPRFVLTIPETGWLEPGAAFRTPNRAVWLEIGFGGGEHLAAQAECHPDISLIGCEVFEPGVAKLLAHIERRNLDNIRIFTNDARLIIAALRPSSIDRVFILFPDPWPKRRHENRRLVSRETLDALAAIMTDGAELSAGCSSKSLNTRLSNGWFEILSIGAIVREIGPLRAMKTRHAPQAARLHFYGSGDGFGNNGNALVTQVCPSYLLIVL